MIKYLTKAILQSCLFFSVAANAQTQIIINEFSQGPATTTGDWIELVVTADGTDIRGVYYDDDNTPGASNVVSSGRNWPDTNTDGLADIWTTLNGVPSIVTGNGFGGNAQRLFADVTVNTILLQNITLEVGVEYKVSFSYRANNGVQPYIWDGAAHTISALTNTGNALEASYTFIATGTSGQLRFYVRSSGGNAQAGDYIEVDNVKVRGLGNLGEEYSVQLKKDLADFQNVSKGSIIVIYRLPKDPTILAPDTDFSDGKIVIPESNTTFLEPGGNGLLLKKNSDQFGIFWDNGNLVDVVGIHGIAWGIAGSASLYSTGWGHTELNNVGAGESAHFTEDTPGEVGTSGNWTIQAFSSATPGTLNGGNNNALPVELMSFSAILKKNLVHLNWMTATEVNNYGFDIERKKENEDWKVLGFVEGHGNTNSPKEYSFLDNDIDAAGIYYYRLKQIDNDGSYEFSQMIEVDFNSPVSFELKQNYPNPFNPSTTITFTLPANEIVSLSVYNMLGEEIQILQNGFLEAGIYSYNFNAEELPSGVYIYNLSYNNKTQTKKMLLLK